MGVLNDALLSARLTQILCLNQNVTMSLLPDLSFDVHDVGYVAYMMVITVVLLLLLSYIFSSYKLFIKSKKQVAEFDGPWSHWLKGNIKDVSTINFQDPSVKHL